MIETIMDGSIQLQKDGDKVTAHVPIEKGKFNVIEKDIEFWNRKKEELCPELYNKRRIIRLTDVSTIPENKIYLYKWQGDDHHISGDPRHPEELNDEALTVIQSFVVNPNTYNKDEPHGGAVCGRESILPIFFLEGKPFDPFTKSPHEIKDAYRSVDGRIKKWG